MARKHTADEIRNISEKIYRVFLERDSGKGSPERMMERDRDKGQKLRARSGMYDHVVREVLVAIGMDEIE